MSFAATMIFYHLIGLGVATAVFLSDSRQGRLLPVFRLATAVVFWPLYVPIVLSGTRPGAEPEVAPSQADRDTMSRRFLRSRQSSRRRWRAWMAGSKTCWRMRPAASAS